jgi:hypothetical protein
MLGLGLLKRHEDLVAQREKHEQFTKDCEERMKKWERANPDRKKVEEKMNKVEPLIFPEEFDVTTSGDVDRALLSFYRDEQGRLTSLRRHEPFGYTAKVRSFEAWLKENDLED